MTPAWQISASERTILILQGQLRAYFRKRCSRSADIDDLVSTTWLAAGKSFQHRCSLRHYLFCIAERVVANTYRQPDRLVLDGSDLEALPAEMRGLDSRVGQAQWKARVGEALAKVQDPYHGVVMLWLAGRDNVEIARALGINHNTVRSRLVRGKSQLFAALETLG